MPVFVRVTGTVLWAAQPVFWYRPTSTDVLEETAVSIISVDDDAKKQLNIVKAPVLSFG